MRACSKMHRWRGVVLAHCEVHERECALYWLSERDFFSSVLHVFQRVIHNSFILEAKTYNLHRLCASVQLRSDRCCRPRGTESDIQGAWLNTCHEAAPYANLGTPMVQQAT